MAVGGGEAACSIGIMTLNSDDGSIVEIDAVRHWAQQHVERLEVKDGELEYVGRSDFHVKADLTADVMLRLRPHKGDIVVHLNGHSMSVMAPAVGRVQVQGPGSIDQVVFDSDAGGTKFAPDGTVAIRRIDSVGSAQTTLEIADAEFTIGELHVDSGPIVLSRSTLKVSELHAVDRSIDLNGRLIADRLEGDHSLRVVRGLLVIGAGGSEIEVVGPAAVQLDGHHIDRHVHLDGGTLEVHDREAVVERCRVSGPSGTVRVSYGRLVQPTFDAPLTLEVDDDGEATSIHGQVRLVMGNSGTISGAQSTGLLLASLSLLDVGSGPPRPRAVESISFLDLDPAFLPVLRDVGSVSGRWPSRPLALRRARAMDCGVRSPDELPNALAHYWLSVEQLLKEKHASGRDLAIAHEVAEDARRRAIAVGSVERLSGVVRRRQFAQRVRAFSQMGSTPLIERGLLELSRLSGYGARIGRPLATWLISAAVFGVMIRASVGGVCLAGCSVDSGLALYWDLLIAPVTFIRPADDGSVLRELMADDLPARVLAFLARAVGTWMLLSLALAVRRYLRTT